MTVVDLAALLEADLPTEWTAPTTKTTAAKGTASETAHALAARLAPSVENHGGDAALFHAATEIATVTGPDAGAIAAVLTETFNPRCAPPWPAAKLEREAQRAAERQADPVMAWARRRESAPVVTPERDDGWPAPIDWQAPLPEIEWYCQALGIAKSDAKITIIGGLAGAGKGPLANYVAVCFATGARVFGSYKVRRAKTLILDFEGARLTSRRIHAHCNGMGIDAAKQLPGNLILQPATPDMMHDITWLERKIHDEGIEVLIVDSYMSAMAEIAVDQNSPEYAFLARQLGALGIVTIVVAHARKPSSTARGERPTLGDIAGSFALGGYAQTGIAVYNPDDEDRLRARVACMRAPEEPFATLDLRWTKEADNTWRVAATSAVRADGDDRARKRVEADTRTARRLIGFMAHNSAHPQKASSVAAACRVSPATAAGLLGALTHVGIVDYQADLRGGGAFVLRPGAAEIVESDDWTLAAPE